MLDASAAKIKTSIDTPTTEYQITLYKFISETELDQEKVSVKSNSQTQ